MIFEMDDVKNPEESDIQKVMVVDSCPGGCQPSQVHGG